MTEFNFREWIRTQHGDYTFVEENENHIRLETSHAIAQINFYQIEGEEEIVEFRIDTVDTQETSFFLHFHANHEEHAKELFAEMTQTLSDLQNQVKKEILLCCTSGLTTSFFAEQLNEKAEQLGMMYSFSAVSVNDIYEAGVGKAAILLAPQIRYMEKQLRSVMPNSAIISIPTKIFGTYDATACIQMVDLEVHKIEEKQKEEQEKKLALDVELSLRILVVSALIQGNKAHIYYRVYSEGKIQEENVVIKKRLLTKDIEDVIDTQVCSCSGKIEVDRIGIAIPGIVHNGVLDLPRTTNTDLTDGGRNHFPMQQYFEEKYGVPVTVNNNTNAAAIGWYGQQIEYSNVVFYSQPRGWAYGGQGIVVDGKVVGGRLDAAGEIKFIVNQFHVSNPLRYNPYNPDHVIEIVAQVILMDIAMLDPEVICLRSELTPDMDEVRKEVAKYIDETHIPKLVYIDNYNEYIMLGELLFALKMGKDIHKSEEMSGIASGDVVLSAGKE